MNTDKIKSGDLIWLPLDGFQMDRFSNNCKRPYCFPKKNLRCHNPNHIICAGYRNDSMISKSFKFMLCGYLPKDITFEEEQRQFINYASWIFLFLRQEFDGLFVEKALYGIMWDFLFSTFNMRETIDYVRIISIKHNNIPKSVSECYKLTKFCMLVAFFAKNNYNDDFINEFINENIFRNIGYTLEEIVNKIKQIFSNPTIQHAEKLKRIEPHIQQWEHICNKSLEEKYYGEINQKVINNLIQLQKFQEWNDLSTFKFVRIKKLYLIEHKNAQNILTLCETKFYKPLCQEIKQSAEILLDYCVKNLKSRDFSDCS